MTTKKIEAVNKEREKILAERAAEMVTLQDAVKAEADKIAEAERDMRAAGDKGDVAGYQQAKGKRQNAADAKEMHEGRIKRLTETTLVTESEYRQLQADITKEMDANTKEAQDKLEGLCDQIAAISDDLREAGHKANDALKNVQADLYGNFDRRLSQDGKRYVDRPAEYTKHYDVLGWAVSCTGAEAYKQLKAQEGGSDGK